MNAPVSRLVLAGLALASGLGLFLTTFGMTPDWPSSVYEYALLVASAVFSLSAIWLTTHHLTSSAQRPDGSLTLLRPDARMQMLRDAPDTAAQRAFVGRILNDEIESRKDRLSGEPPRFEEGLGRAVRRILNAWARRDAREATDEEILDLYTFCQLMTATAPEAGRLLQAFLKPEHVLDLRQEMIEIGQSHDRYSLQRDQFIAAQSVWQSPPTDGSTLLKTLERFNVPDQDLWHHIVLRHEPRFKDQGEAALWCLSQPDCDQATIAAFFVRAVEEKLLTRAARTGNAPYLDRVSLIIRMWNKGDYSRSELAYEVGQGAKAYAGGLANELDRAADILNLPHMTSPVDVFRDYAGRAPRARGHWNLSRGTITAAPQADDYIDAHDSAA